MKHIISGFAIGVLTIAASAALAAPGNGGGRGMGEMMRPATFGAQSTRMQTIHTMMTPAPAAPAASARTQSTTQSTTHSSAAAQTHTTGQPNASCEATPNTPGNSASAPGSAFNPDGVSGTKYAGEQPQNSKNPVSVSQYDVACANQPH